MKAILYFTLTGISLLACKSNQKSPVSSSAKSMVETQESAIKPIEGLEIKPRVFTINSSTASKIDLPNGGSIEFQANSFHDKQGNPVSGNVQINWKEYHSLTDIALSGIPMKYDSNGVSNDFVSGGMFTISANQNGKKLDLVKGKPATVNLASIDDTPCYNFYKIDETKGDWTYIDTKNGIPIQDSVVSAKPVEANEIVLDVQVDIKAFSELNKKTIVGWKTKEKLSQSEKNVLKNANHTAELKRVGKKYAIVLATKNSTRNITVEPLTLQEANKNQSIYKSKFKRDFSELLEYQKNVAQGKVVRSIEIDGMGTYNWDKVLKRQQEYQILALFDFKTDTDPNAISVFYYSPEENVIIKCNSGGEPKFKFDPTKTNAIIAILSDNSVKYVDPKTFSKVGNKQEHTFEFSDMHLKVKSPEELGEIMKNAFLMRS